MQRLTYILAFALLLGACTNKPQESRRLNVDDDFAIEIPGRFQRSYDMHDFAPLQLEDPEAEAYMIGLTQEKSELEEINMKYTLEDYAWFLSRNISGGIDTVYDSYSMTTDVNGHEAIYTEISGEVQDGFKTVPIHYSVAVLEGSDRFYEFVCWGKESETAKLQSEMHAMICTFQEIGTTSAGGAAGSGAGAAN